MSADTRVAALGRRSGAVLEALADAFAAPAAPLPAPVSTGMRRDAGRWLGATPLGQRLAVRGALAGLDLIARIARPRTGFAARSRTARLALLARLARVAPPIEAAVDALGRIAVLAYWSDAGVRGALARIDADGAVGPAPAAGGPAGRVGLAAGTHRAPAVELLPAVDLTPGDDPGPAEAGGRR
jgi:hypothetical protein